jgi:hypothetical protein
MPVTEKSVLDSQPELTYHCPKCGCLVTTDTYFDRLMDPVSCIGCCHPDIGKDALQPRLASKRRQETTA